MNYKPNTEFHPILPFLSLLKREIIRIKSVLLQAIIGPVITSFLYLLIFGVQIGKDIPTFHEVSYIEFIVPGLVLMGIIRSSFMNASNSLFFYRYIGSIVELLVLPVPAHHFVSAFTLAAMARGFIIGILTLLVSTAFITLPWVNPGLAILMAVFASALFAQFGLLVALVSNTFESLSLYDNFILLPLIYFGGLFYPLEKLPAIWAELSYFNPIYYMIDGFRHAALGTGSSSIYLNVSVVATTAIVLFSFVSFIFSKGYKLRR